MARILVIGAGVFGTLAAAELARHGHEAVLASRRRAHLRVDARDEASVAAAVQASAAEVVLHTAGPFQDQPPAVARSAARLGVPYVDISDDASFSARVAATPARVPLLTGMSTTPAAAEALATLALARVAAPRAVRCTLYAGGANRQGPATMRFAAQARATGASALVDVPGVGRRRAFPARAWFQPASGTPQMLVALGGLPGVGWRFRPLVRWGASLGARLPRLGDDTSGALIVDVQDASGRWAAREALHASRHGQRLAILPALWAIEEVLAGRAPTRACLPREWVDATALVGFLTSHGFERGS